MSSRIDTTQAKGSRRAPSLTTRIATVVALAAAVVFALTGYVLDQALARQLEERDTAELLGKLQQVRHVLGEHGSADALRKDPHPLVDLVFGHSGLVLVVLEGDGTVIFSSSPTAQLPEPQTLVPLEMPASAQDVALRNDRNGQKWRVLGAQAMPGSTDATPVQVWLGSKNDSISALLAAYRRTLLPAIALAALGTALLGWFAAWRGLRPLARVASAAGHLTANRLGERIEVLVASREVAELASAFNTMTDRLQDSFTRLSRFSGDLAHDLKTPLTTLMVQSQVALSKARNIEEYQNLLESNIEEFQRLSRMVDSMLFLARADNAQIALNPQLLGASAELQHMVEYLEPLAEERGLSFAVEAQGQIPADAALLRRALGNLMSNAIRHARQGSRITLRSAEVGPFVEVSVANEGEPIAAEHLPHLFDRFYRADTARSDSSASTGLGLAIVQSILELHGGEVSIRREAAGLNCFVLRFPRSPVMTRHN